MLHFNWAPSQPVSTISPINSTFTTPLKLTGRLRLFHLILFNSKPSGAINPPSNYPCWVQNTNNVMWTKDIQHCLGFLTRFSGRWTFSGRELTSNQVTSNLKKNLKSEIPTFCTYNAKNVTRTFPTMSPKPEHWELQVVFDRITFYKMYLIIVPDAFSQPYIHIYHIFESL